ncbi:MAG: hypothetical protein AB9835_13810 [Eubacteriales bacterium]
MKKQLPVRVLPLLLSLLIMLPLIFSCSQSTEQGGKETTTTAQETLQLTTEDPGPQSSLPADLDFGGETINIWYFTKNSDVSESFVDLQGDIEGDVVDSAIYKRNRDIEEQLNIKLNFIDSGVASSDTGSAVRKQVLSGTTDFDLYNLVQWNSSTLAMENLFLNLADAPYLDIDKPWWAGNYIKEVGVGSSNIYFLCGDITIDMIRCIASMYYNKKIYQDVYGDPNELYSMVLNGEWTLDKMTELIKGASKDLNGDDKLTFQEDTLGMATNNYNNLDGFFYGAGARATGRDAEGLPVLALNDARTASVMEKLHEICNNTIGVYLNTNNNAGQSTLDNVTNFKNGLALLQPGWFYTSEWLRDMEDDYGIIPFPKYDAEQENYQSIVHDIATLMCVPTTCTKFDAVCATLEAMAYNSYKNVTPAYYEVAMKVKYSRDEMSSQIIDLLHDNNMTDIAYVYGSSFNNLGYIVRELVPAKTLNFASSYEKKEAAALKNMQKLIDQYLALE